MDNPASANLHCALNALLRIARLHDPLKAESGPDDDYDCGRLAAYEVAATIARKAIADIEGDRRG